MSQRGTSNGGNDTGSAIIIQGSQLSGNLLHGLRSHIPGMRVTTPAGQCPRILFRGELSARGHGNPTVYVDGVMMIDTCILNEISTNDVERVEVYVGGNSPYGNLQRNPFGIIFIVRQKE